MTISEPDHLPAQPIIIAQNHLHLHPPRSYRHVGVLPIACGVLVLPTETDRRLDVRVMCFPSCGSSLVLELWLFLQPPTYVQTVNAVDSLSS